LTSCRRFGRPIRSRRTWRVSRIDRLRRRRTVDFLVDVNRQVQQKISYVIRLDHACRTWSARSSWRQVPAATRRGCSCNFFPPPWPRRTLRLRLPDPVDTDVKALAGPTGVDRDFTDLPRLVRGVLARRPVGIGLDPTSGLLAGEGHIPLACTPDPMSAAPVSGGVEECEVDFVHEMSAAADRRIAARDEALQPTHSGKRSSRAVARSMPISRAGDVRLTMGGEPTFVSTTDSGR